MKKLLILLISIPLIAASCNQVLFGSSGAMGVFRSDDLGVSFHATNQIDRKNNLNSTSVNSLVFDPNNSQVIYLGSAAGLYKTENSGDTWKLLVTNILVGDSAVDPVASSTVYAVGLSGGKGKIIKTSDSGSSWKDLYTEPTNSNTVVSVAIDSTDHNHILAGLQNGEVIHSQDAGATWQVIVDLSDQIYRIRFGPNKNAYVLTFTNGLYESKDNAKTFTNISNTLTSGLLNFNTDFSSVSRFLDLGFDVRQLGVIYLATDAGLIRTIDDGANWSYMKMPLRNSLLRTSAVAVNPKDSNNLYAVVGSTLFKSINGGVTWETKPLPTNQEVRTILIDGTSPNVIYLGLGARK